MAVSASDQVRHTPLGLTTLAPERARRLGWPASAALILVMSAALWALILQCLSWLGVF